MGYWLPHSSSVDFCEPNYLLSNYIVEPHNTWSSLLISLIALVGLLYGNPTREWSVAIMYVVLTVIGIGSAGLHSTMHWLLQSSDEVPMLWQILSFLHLLTQLRLTSTGASTAAQRLVGYAFIALTVIQTVLYYRFQQVYVIFIGSIILYSMVIALWTASLFKEKIAPDQQAIRWLLWKWAFICYVVLGFGLWVLDMALCAQLLPLYRLAGGATLHIFWHIFASLGSYLIATFLVVVRLQRSGKLAALRWVLPFIPVCQAPRPLTNRSPSILSR
jgi:dihydroceramidase